MVELPKKYILDFKVRFTYNSNNISGNTISLSETFSLVANQYVTEGNKELNKIYEIVNHAEAVEYMLLSSRERLSVEYIKFLHKILLSRLNPERGVFKKKDNYIVGVEFSTTSAKKVEEVMEYFVSSIIQKLQSNIPDIFEFLAKIHLLFERIYPFDEGNGRMNRLITNKILLDLGFAPIVIEGGEKAYYYQQLLVTQNTPALTQYFKELSANEQQRIDYFRNENN